MKVIDLLNKIANGEEIPKKFKYRNHIYTYIIDSYQNEFNGEFAVCDIAYNFGNLNDEIEIIATIDEDKLNALELFGENEYLHKENERLNNKVEEFMALYESEREVKEDYKSIIKEVNDRLSTILEINEKYEVEDIESLYSKKWLRETIQELKETLDKGGE